jgi:hypothetical protein
MMTAENSQGRVVDLPQILALRVFADAGNPLAGYFFLGLLSQRFPVSAQPFHTAIISEVAEEPFQVWHF